MKTRRKGNNGEQAEKYRFGEYTTCCDVAIQFSNIAERCNKRAHENSKDVEHNYLYPWIVNMAISCELFMKTIMIKRSDSSQFMEGHGLKTLFNALESVDQHAIAINFEATYHHSTLLQTLESCSNAFKEWRYPMETKTLEIEVSALYALMNVLKEYVLGLGDSRE